MCMCVRACVRACVCVLGGGGCAHTRMSVCVCLHAYIYTDPISYCLFILTTCKGDFERINQFKGKRKKERQKNPNKHEDTQDSFTLSMFTVIMERKHKAATTISSNIQCLLSSWRENTKQQQQSAVTSITLKFCQPMRQKINK